MITGQPVREDLTGLMGLTGFQRVNLHLYTKTQTYLWRDDLKSKRSLIGVLA